MEIEQSQTASPTVVPLRAWPDVDHVTIEDDTPVDGRISTRQMRLLVNPLKDSWNGPSWDSRFDCDANVGVFESVNLPPIVPDFFLVIGVTWPENLHLKRNRSYFIEGIGKSPDLVVEVVSNTIGGEDTKKLVDYAHLKVRYYLIHDPERHLSNEVLRAYELIDGRFQRLTGTWLAGVDLGFTMWPGTFEGLPGLWLRWVDQNGRLIPTGPERADQEREAAELRVAEERVEREAAERRAAQERAEREAAELRAAQERESAEQRIAALEARLRELETGERS